MKTKTLIICTTFLLFACKESEKTKTELPPNIHNETPNVEEEKSLTFLKETKPTLKNWTKYYKELDPNFNVNKFKPSDSYKLEPMNGSVYGVFDKEFDPTYADFLIYNSTQEKYIDLDSYNMTIEGDEIYFEPDQEINVVNIPEKTVTRIGFYGPSYWVEDAYWKNDHTVILLENNFDKIPMISEINLKTNEVSVYSYQNALKNESNYSNQRIQKISNK